MWAGALASRASAETIWLSLDRNRRNSGQRLCFIAPEYKGEEEEEKKTVWCLRRCCQAAVWPVSQEETLHLWPLPHTSLLLLTLPFLPDSSQSPPWQKTLSSNGTWCIFMQKKIKPYYFAIPFITGILLRVSVWRLQQLLVSHGTFSRENLFKLFPLLLCWIQLIFKVKHRNFFFCWTV